MRESVGMRDVDVITIGCEQFYTLRSDCFVDGVRSKDGQSKFLSIAVKLLCWS